MIIYILLII